MRDEAASEMAFVPRRLEVAFGSERAAPELQRGLDLGDGLRLSGKIDRIDIDPFSARGIVQDYKSGKGAHSARGTSTVSCACRSRCTSSRSAISSGSSRSAASTARSPGRRADARDAAGVRARGPARVREETTTSTRTTFWAQVETARERAATNAQRIRAGDVQHDPKGDGCPAWCDLWPICRVPRS